MDERYWRSTDAPRQTSLQAALEAAEPHGDVEYDPQTDHNLIILDRLLELAHATDAYFQEHPEVDAFITQMTLYADERCESQEKRQIVCRFDYPGALTAANMRYMALSVYEELAFEQVLAGQRLNPDGTIDDVYEQVVRPLEKALADDVVESWRDPSITPDVFEYVRQSDVLPSWQKEADSNG